MSYPDVSIIICNYNYGKYISRAIRSCLAQRNVNLEIIVVDDCSTDDSIDKILSFGDDVKLIKNPKNLGVAESSNVGINAARGRFVIRVDSDDFVNKDMCYFLITYLESNMDAFCVSCDYWLVDDNENKIERKYAKVDNVSCGILYRKDQLINLGGYNTKMRHREEEELRKRLGTEYKVHNLEIPFYRYRMHQNNKTKTNEYKNTII